MNRKRIGTTAERELVNMFWKAGWAAIRVAGSGSSQNPSPDVVAGKAGRILTIECKVSENPAKYFPHTEIEQLKLFADTLGGEPWIGIKYKGLNWYFIGIEDLEQTEKHFTATLTTVKRRGLLFEELIEA